MNNRNVLLNTVAVVVSYGVGMFINFFISPYLVRTLGAEALGFLKLAGDFTSYATLLTIAVNSMASRYLMLARERRDSEMLKTYFSTLFFSNVFVAVITLFLFTVVIIYLDRMVEVPWHLLAQVRISYGITFLSFCLSLIFSVYGVCFYLLDRLYVGTWRATIGNLVAQIAVLLLLYFFEPSIIYMVAGGAIAGLYTTITNFYFFRRWLPELRVSCSYFSFARLRELLASGIWNSITKLSQIFSSGLDLLISNIFLSAAAMGYLSVAKTIPGLMVGIYASLAASFSPNLMQHYARGNMQELKKAAKTAVKFMALFVSLPTAVLIVFGTEFFRLWMPTLPAELINILSILTLANSCVTGPMQPLYQIFTITNKVKQSSLVIIMYGFVSILLTLILLKTTELGLFAVAGVSLVGSLIVALGYHLPFSAIYIGLPWYEFFPVIGKSVLSLVLMCAVGFAVKMLAPSAESWLLWFVCSMLMGVIGLVANLCIVLEHAERRTLFVLMGKKLHLIK